MSEAVLKRLIGKFGDAVLESHSAHGDETALVLPEKVLEMALWLRDDPANAFDFMRDVTAVDYLGYSQPKRARFEVVYHLYSLTKKHALRLKVPLDGEAPTMPSLVSVWAACNWGEREVWDMYGVRFSGHPDLRRVLLYEEFEGFPLRKDYDKRRSQPRCDLLAPERDAIAEYRRWDVAKNTESAT